MTLRGQVALRSGLDRKQKKSTGRAVSQKEHYRRRVTDVEGRLGIHSYSIHSANKGADNISYLMSSLSNSTNYL